MKKMIVTFEIDNYILKNGLKVKVAKGDIIWNKSKFLTINPFSNPNIITSIVFSRNNVEHKNRLLNSVFYLI